MFNAIRRGAAKLVLKELGVLGDEIDQLQGRLERLEDTVSSLSDRFTRAQKGRRDSSLLFDPVALEQVGKFLRGRPGANGGGEFDQ